MSLGVFTWLREKSGEQQCIITFCLLFWGEGNQSSSSLRHLQLANMKVAECGQDRYYYVNTVQTSHVL